jgi:succinoglycan biosynthesis protein ExoM
VIQVSVCICTFRRPVGLERLLRSLRHLDPASPSHEIIVVDNDAAATAEPVVTHARENGLDVLYIAEPKQGIARARNRSIEAARGEYVAFIDDDEEADPRWLRCLWEEVVHRGATAGVGPVLPQFSERAPRWLIDSGVFERRRLATGTVLHATDTRAGNALIERRALEALSGPFDQRFDFTGGEDGEFFARLIDSGARVVAVDNAIVYEHLTSRRTTLRWLWQRRLRTSIDAARLLDRGTPANWRRLRSLRWLARALVCASASVISFPISRNDGFYFMLVAAERLAQFMYLNGLSVRPYRRNSWR